MASVRARSSPEACSCIVRNRSSANASKRVVLASSASAARALNASCSCLCAEANSRTCSRLRIFDLLGARLGDGLAALGDRQFAAEFVEFARGLRRGCRPLAPARALDAAASACSARASATDTCELRNASHVISAPASAASTGTQHVGHRSSACKVTVTRTSTSPAVTGVGGTSAACGSHRPHHRDRRGGGIAVRPFRRAARPDRRCDPRPRPSPWHARAPPPRRA